MPAQRTHNNSGDGRVDGGTLADLDLVDLLLEHRTAGVGARYHVDLDDGLGVTAAVVRRLDRDAVLLAGVELTDRLD